MVVRKMIQSRERRKLLFLPGEKPGKVSGVSHVRSAVSITRNLPVKMSHAVLQKFRGHVEAMKELPTNEKIDYVKDLYDPKMGNLLRKRFKL